MTILQALILGIVQGITEFLPISSSAHLVIVPYLLRWEIPEEQVFPFDVIVQMGTLIAVIVYFRKDIKAIIRAMLTGFTNLNRQRQAARAIRQVPSSVVEKASPWPLMKRALFADPMARLGWLVILATIPAGLAGVLLKPLVEKAFHSPVVTALFLLVTAGILLAAEHWGRRSRLLNSLTWKDAIWVGLAQAISIFPGISRSGSTIAGGMARHLVRVDAGRFSFLLSIPIMLAAGLVSILDVLKTPGVGTFIPILLFGMVVSGLVGYVSIHWLLGLLNRRTLKGFAIYCILISLVVIVFSFII